MEIRELQKFIKVKDYKPELLDKYFLKLAEEVGELSRAMRKDWRMKDNQIKGTIEEELYDVMYYVMAIANIYDIDLERCHELKDELNKVKYGRE